MSVAEYDYSLYIMLYTVTSFVLGMDWAVFNWLHYSLASSELRLFLTIINIGVITAALGSLSVWLPAYLYFSIPQMISLIVGFWLNNQVFILLGILVYSVFMLLMSRNLNHRFIEARLLTMKNIELFEKMDEEIRNRKDIQKELEQYQYELEDIVEMRTRELVSSNRDLKQQIERNEEVERDLEKMAYYDVLTELPNRSLLIERIVQVIQRAKRNGTMFSILFVDLDRFKAINDSLGHAAGDELICQVARRLRKMLRETDTIARNGGDEFVILLENESLTSQLKDMRESYIVAQKIIESINEPFEIDDHTVHVGSSIGIAIYPFDGEDALDLLKKSDTAMYVAKGKGRNHFEFYSTTMSNQIQRRLKLETELRSALDNNEFRLVLQPQVDISTGITAGFEALIRWRNPQLGSVPPSDFVPVLEETGMIYAVGEWVIKEVLQLIRQGVTHDCKVSVNLSALQCGVTRYCDRIRQLIEDAQVDPALIEFEVTESLLIDDFEKTEYFLTNIHKLGCTVALDDFGTGYTSFSYLARLPIDVIKIDRSLVTNINTEKSLQDIVQAIVMMSKSLGITNIFEGVENEQELEQVRQLEARYIQGYLFSRPLEIAELDKWFEVASKQRIA